MSATDDFVAQRALLFTIAYEVLGSAADAEDVLQETWLRWSRVEVEVHDPRAYLVRVTTRMALNRLRTVRRQRETYVGPWLPEPLLTTADVADDVELAESVSMALMTVLETLSPAERVVFVLREVFDLPYVEIADVLDRSVAAVRQLAHRARGHVAARQPRVRVAREERDRVTASFARAASSGDLQGLLDVLAPDVVLITDGGGARRAAIRPVIGRDKVLRFMQGMADPRATADLHPVNGAPALVVVVGGEVDTVVAFAVEGGFVAGLYVVRNPAKLARVSHPVRLARQG